MEINLLSFDMPNTMYNINSKNNEFEIITPNETVIKTIPSGNYSIKTLMAQLKILIENDFITITYNEAQNTYTFTKSDELIEVYKINNFYGKKDIINILISIDNIMKDMINTILFAINRLRLLL